MADQVRRIMGELETVSTRAIRKLVLDIHADLVEQTPVNLGWARSNWVPSVGDPFNGPAGSPGSIDAGPQTAGVSEVATQYRISDGAVFITNNVPYIEKLNQGSSPKAPAGFVDAIVEGNVKALSQTQRL